MRDEHVQEAIWQRGGDFQSSLRQLASRCCDAKTDDQWFAGNPYVSFDLGLQANLAKIAFIRMMKERGILVAGVNSIMYAHTDRMFEQFLTVASESFEGGGRFARDGLLEEYVGENTGIGSFARLA